ncbi:Zinc metalloproteinase [Colletotrichum higginsianum IMI 349063]|uniref:Zinc metalloproteinase n=2 Tax=Colletotrichum higginsianum TaxID=80884 RepID=A0A1B7YL86_COLHI|nr:Zinc metalloproteinase [Colletotrichum higginsianum IMI 349063]OBR12801.1 Zinc metalloproteinase [Colletotrichum higginsianum IMI 349063]
MYIRYDKTRAPEQHPAAPMAPVEHTSARMSLKIDNFEDGETVRQRCVIVKGTYSVDGDNADTFATVETHDGISTDTIFPTQSWPIAGKQIKIIAMLSPGRNTLAITRSVGADKIVLELNLNYVPLLQSPPLHLAIMVAKDSPLVIDCPPAKHGLVSSAHSSLDAAIAKLRMTAYMWQALTAEDMSMKGLGRRSFRLEEEWTADTTSRAFLDGLHEAALFETGAMRATARVHVVRSSRTTAEIRDAEVAQQNESARSRDGLFDYFREALAAHGAPFDPSSHPVVAGMILDSHFSAAKKLILGHAALGCRDPTGVSLGIMGSHLAYSWPRFLEEVADCLLDARPPGPAVGDDNGECGSFWEACAIGQGAFLHEVGHAFGAPHTTGIMARGYARHWPRSFLARTAYSRSDNREGLSVVDDDTENDARWDLRDALSFRSLDHFWLPGDARLPGATRSAAPAVSPVNIGTDDAGLEIFCAAGLARVEFNGQPEPLPSVREPFGRVFYGLEALESRFPRGGDDLAISVLGMNGKTKTVRNAWRLFVSTSHVRIPGSDVLLQKRSVTSKNLEDADLSGGSEDNDAFWTWATLLTRRKDVDDDDGDSGAIVQAASVDVRTGCVLDGAYVHFYDDARVHCGPRVSRWGGALRFGGHASEEVAIPLGVEVVKVEVSREDHILRGMRVHLSDGTSGGALSGGGDEPETLSLEPQADERIVGFFGRSWWGRHFDGLVEFGIITAPRDFVLPDVVYGMAELQNTDGGRRPEEIKEHEGSDDEEY